MRKKIFISIFIFVVCLPLLILVVSYTRFFNEQVRSLLTSIVDDRTNARLYIGEIHGSILGSFKIDGAALMYHDKPVALVDTIEIYHAPLSLLAKTVEAFHVNLINPRFYLTRYKDGTYNVDCISKQPPKPGGKFDWTIMLKSLSIHNGEFSLYDSTRVDGSLKLRRVLTSDSISSNTFDASNFDLHNIDLLASANFSGNKLTAGIRNISLNIEPADFVIDSLRFGFSTSDAGTEISNFNLRSSSAQIRLGASMTGQNLLDSLDIEHIRRKQFTANVDAHGVSVKDLEKFIDLPISPVSTVHLACAASGSLDTLKVKRFFLTTDSSYVPAIATFYNVATPSMMMKVQTSGAVINSAELSALLRNTNLPSLGPSDVVDASVEGHPGDLNVALRLKSGDAEILGSSHIYAGSYDGKLTFRRIDVGRILRADFKTHFTGDAVFSLKHSTSKIPRGKVTLEIDSSNYDDIAIQNGTVDVSSNNDSLAIDLKLSTSKGNIGGTAALDAATKNYNAEMSFSELDVAPFVRVRTLKGNFSGGALISGSGFDLDSINARASVLIDHGTLGGFPIDSSTFTAALNTKNSEKDLRFRSPFLDASVNGDFVPHELPSQLSVIFSTLAKKFSDRVAGRFDSAHTVSGSIDDLNASVNVNVKDARFVGRLLGVPELYGDPSAYVNLLSDGKTFSIDGELTIDTLNYMSGEQASRGNIPFAGSDTITTKLDPASETHAAKDSLCLSISNANVQFNLKTDGKLSVWNSGGWSVNGGIGAIGINGTRIAAKVLKIDYEAADTSSSQNSLLPRMGSMTISTLASVDTLLNFYLDASADVEPDSIDITAGTLVGKLYGVSLASEAPVHVVYSREDFKISPAIFSARYSDDSADSHSNITCRGIYSIDHGADLQFMFARARLATLQRLARLDTNSLKLGGEIDGDADLSQTESGLLISIDFDGKNINYNGSAAKLINGNVKINSDYAELSAQLSKENDSTRFALRMGGIIPLSNNSGKDLDLRLTADSLDISFLTPFLTGVDNFGGVATGDMDVSGRYSSPKFKGNLQIADGRLLLAANTIPYSFDGTIIGQGDDRLLTSPVSISSTLGRTTETMTASGFLRIDDNTIEQFDVNLDGTLLALNSTSRASEHGIYGTAVVGSGKSGLMLKGSLARPMLDGSMRIHSADLTLLPLQKKSENATQQIIYHFMTDTMAESKANSSKDGSEKGIAVSGKPRSSPERIHSEGSILDSLRYDLDVETKDNVGLMMIFDPNTNEKLYALLGGSLHLSNLSGAMVLTGDVNVQNNSYYNFYKQFAASGKLIFTGDPLNPTLDITAEYQADHYVDTSNSKPQHVVVKIKMTGTFDSPKPDISMTVDNNPFQGDPQTNAVSFIAFGQFADDLSPSTKQSAANNVWSQAGTAAIGSVGSSLLSGILTNLLAPQLSFIQSVSLQYNPNSSISDPDLSIKSKIGPGTFTVQSPLVTSDISNTGFSLTYPMPFLSNLVAEASRSVAVTNRALSQRETVDMLRFYYQISF